MPRRKKKVEEVEAKEIEVVEVPTLEEVEVTVEPEVKEAEAETPVEHKDTRTRIAEVVDMDKKLEEVTPTSGRTRFQQYMREKIKNADIEKA